MPKPELVAIDVLSGVIEEARFMAAIRSANIFSSSSGVDGIVKLDSCRCIAFVVADDVELEASDCSSRIASVRLLLRVLMVRIDSSRSIVSTLTFQYVLICIRI